MHIKFCLANAYKMRNILTPQKNKDVNAGNARYKK